jgi:hypothetical protein
MLTPSLADASKLGLVFLVGSAAAQSFPITTILPSAEDVALAASQEQLYSYGRSPKLLPHPRLQVTANGKMLTVKHESLLIK